MQALACARMQRGPRGAKHGGPSICKDDLWIEQQGQRAADVESVVACLRQFPVDVPPPTPRPGVEGDPAGVLSYATVKLDHYETVRAEGLRDELWPAMQTLRGRLHPAGHIPKTFCNCTGGKCNSNTHLMLFMLHTFEPLLRTTAQLYRADVQQRSARVPSTPSTSRTPQPSSITSTIIQTAQRPPAGPLAFSTPLMQQPASPAAPPSTSTMDPRRLVMPASERAATMPTPRSHPTICCIRSSQIICKPEHSCATNPCLGQPHGGSAQQFAACCSTPGMPPCIIHVDFNHA